MSNTPDHQRLPERAAYALARKIMDCIAPACDRVEIVGSVRRRTPHVGDIDLLLIQRELRTVFSQGPILDDLLQHLIDQGKLGPPELDGPKVKKLPIIKHPGVALNLFILQPGDDNAWGMHSIVRTGSADFARRMVTAQDKGGHRPEYIDIRDGFRVFLDGSFLPCPEEADVFRAYGMAFVQPKERR